jgi:hypothetical protein
VMVASDTIFKRMEHPVRDCGCFSWVRTAASLVQGLRGAVMDGTRPARMVLS